MIDTRIRHLARTSECSIPNTLHNVRAQCHAVAQIPHMLTVQYKLYTSNSQPAHLGKICMHPCRRQAVAAARKAPQHVTVLLRPTAA